jgi:hypothetical protein
MPLLCYEATVSTRAICCLVAALHVSALEVGLLPLLCWLQALAVFTRAICCLVAALPALELQLLLLLCWLQESAVKLFTAKPSVV